MTLRRFAIAALCISGFAAPVAAAPVSMVALTEPDEAAYRQAFDAIEARDWRAVNSALRHVDDDVLVGAVRGRMLLAPAYRPNWAELTQWLERYGEYGMASAVYDRAMANRPSPRRRYRPPAVRTAPTPSHPDADRTPPGDSRAARVALARVAEAMGAANADRARSLANDALSTARDGQAHWWLGLIAFREQDYANAVQHFEASAQWPYHGAWSSAAAHYWAARARLAVGETQGVSLHLEAAAQNPWTFYGQLAEAQLGRDTALSFVAPELDTSDAIRFLDRHDAARRAAALAQLGRLSEVESELRGLVGELNQNEFRTYLALGVALSAPSAQLRAAEYGGPEMAAGYCPANSFAPDHGFELDRAVIYAIIRQESRFNPTAVSVSNARGLMQLLPSTANDIDRSYNFRRQPAQLFDPGLNMRLGQSYVRWLIDEFHNDADLGRVFAAYNGGPGWLRRWMANQPDNGDPLMLLETLSRTESRDYAERVLSHMALCRKALGQPTPEMDRLASGEAAAYQPLDARMAGR
jgi:soluble lytic murein transglycosylase-like protein